SRIPSAMPIPMGGVTTISIIMSQKQPLPKHDRWRNVRIAISRARRRMRFGPSSIPCWTSDKLTLSRLGEECAREEFRYWRHFRIAADRRGARADDHDGIE